MNIKRSIRIAAVAAVASAGFAGQAQAFTPAGTISNGAPRPVVKWDHAAWKKCWAITYAQWREDGASVHNSATAADWTCGPAPL